MLPSANWEPSNFASGLPTPTSLKQWRAQFINGKFIPGNSSARNLKRVSSSNAGIFGIPGGPPVSGEACGWFHWFFFALFFFRSTFLPAYWLIAILGCAKILILKPSKSKTFLKESQRKTNPLHLPYRLFSKAGRHHHVFFPSRRLHWRFQVDLEGCWKIKSDMAGGAFFWCPVSLLRWLSRFNIPK